MGRGQDTRPKRPKGRFDSRNDGTIFQGLCLCLSFNCVFEAILESFMDQKSLGLVLWGCLGHLYGTKKSWNCLWGCLGHFLGARR